MTKTKRAEEVVRALLISGTRNDRTARMSEVRTYEDGSVLAWHNTDKRYSDVGIWEWHATQKEYFQMTGFKAPKRPKVAV